MTLTRRSLLAAGLTLPALNLRAASRGAAGFQSPLADSSFDPWVEVNRANLQHNVAEIARRVESRPILAVIKNNGYGMGTVNAGRLMEPLPAIAGFAVVKMHEAMALRDAGIRKPVLLMGPFDERNLEDLIARDIMPMVYTPIGPALDRIAAARQKPIPLHICIDTGIGRVGVPFRQALPLVRDLAGRKSVRLEGVMMTFTEDPAFDPEQLSRFRSLCECCGTGGVNVGRRHSASSFTLFQRPEAFLDMVRPGMALYGVYLSLSSVAPARSTCGRRSRSRRASPTSSSSRKATALATIAPTSPKTMSGWPPCRSGTPTACRATLSKARGCASMEACSRSWPRSPPVTASSKWEPSRA